MRRSRGTDVISRRSDPVSSKSALVTHDLYRSAFDPGGAVRKTPPNDHPSCNAAAAPDLLSQRSRPGPPQARIRYRSASVSVWPISYRRVRSALDEVHDLASWPPSVAALGRASAPPGPANGWRRTASARGLWGVVLGYPMVIGHCPSRRFGMGDPGPNSGAEPWSPSPTWSSRVWFS
jgi:hypothetical protein